MPFLDRNEANEITGVYACQQRPGQEFSDSARLLPPAGALVATPWQIRKALNAVGMRAAVEVFAANASQDARDGWERATEFREDDPLLAAAAGALGADLHALLTLAVTL